MLSPFKGVCQIRVTSTWPNTGVEGEPSDSDSRAYLQSGLRGIKVVAAAASVEIKTDSQAVAEYKQGTSNIQKANKTP